MQKESKIYLAGHRGLVGSALMRRLEAEAYQNILTKSHTELDLCRQQAVEDFFAQEKPEYVFLAAAKVGGIGANERYSADFIRENLLIQTNVISAASKHGVKKLLFLGSSCIYPKEAKQPMREEELLSGKLENTNEAYAIAKIAGIMLCQSYNRQYGTQFISVMPTNLYGLNDNYDLENSHVLPALIRKFHEAKEEGRKEVLLWGSGRPKREFLYSDDLASACLFLMERYSKSEIINIGSGEELSIDELASKIKIVVGFEGEICYDRTKPDGTLRKLLDSSEIRKLGWRHEVNLDEGLALAYQDFLKRYESMASKDAGLHGLHGGIMQSKIAPSRTA